ncbi:hypothetical protein ACC684_28350 [Rhizobium ruizarguesonis]
MADFIKTIDGMTPRQVAEMLKLAKLQEGGMEPFWVDMAARVVMHTASVALALENDEEVRKNFGRSEGFPAYSLQAIRLLVIDENKLNMAVKVVHELANFNDALAQPLKEKMLIAAVNAGSWLATQYHSVRSEEIALRWKGSIESLFSTVPFNNELTAPEIQVLTNHIHGTIAPAHV